MTNTTKIRVLENGVRVSEEDWMWAVSCQHCGCVSFSDSGAKKGSRMQCPNCELWFSITKQGINESLSQCINGGCY